MCLMGVEAALEAGKTPKVVDVEEVRRDLRSLVLKGWQPQPQPCFSRF